MRNISASALLNLKEQPNSLTIHGSVMVFRADDKVTFERAVPQGINPTILLMDLTIVDGTGPMKGTPTHFHYTSTDADVATFKEVQIRCKDEETVKVTVVTLG
jgi:hypothetical protein